MDQSFPHEYAGFPGLDTGDAFIAEQGAQVLSWRGAGRERLYLSAQSGGMRRGDQADAQPAALRGGIPVCFPQFSDRGNMVKHGFARLVPWHCDRIAPSTTALSLHDNPASLAIWPHRFFANVTVVADATQLEVTLSVTNRGDAPLAFTVALHTYLRVADIRTARLLGLQDARYQDATDNNVEKLQGESAIAVTGELDRVYLSPPSSLQLTENGMPSLTIAQSGFVDTVVWNPGPEKARALKDFPDDDWLHMLCVEAACVAQPVRLAPGATWSGTQVLNVPMS